MSGKQIGFRLLSYLKKYTRLLNGKSRARSSHESEDIRFSRSRFPRCALPGDGTAVTADLVRWSRIYQREDTRYVDREIGGP